MQYSDILSTARRFIDEVTESSRYTNDFLKILINGRYMDIASRLIELNDSHFGTSIADIALVSGTSLYSLTDLDSDSYTRISHILHVKIAYDGTNYYHADKIQPLQIPDSPLQNSRFTQNNPAYSLRGTSIEVYPEPSANASAGIKIYYNQRPTELTSDTDVPQFEPMHHIAIAYGAAADALIADLDANDSPIIDRYERLFESRVEKLLEVVQPLDSYPATVIDVDSTIGVTQEQYVAPGSVTL